jgi:hypothetical protein
MSVYDFKGKSPEDVLQDFVAHSGKTVESITAAIRVTTVDLLCRTISTTGGDFVKQSNALRESLNEFRKSLDKFQESNKHTSDALNKFTLVIAIAAGLQVLLTLYKIILP